MNFEDHPQFSIQNKVSEFTSRRIRRLKVDFFWVMQAYTVQKLVYHCIVFTSWCAPARPIRNPPLVIFAPVVGLLVTQVHPL